MTINLFRVLRSTLVRGIVDLFPFCPGWPRRASSSFRHLTGEDFGNGITSTFGKSMEFPRSCCPDHFA